MNINTGLNPYNSNYVNGADLTKMSQSQSLTGSVTDSLKEGEIFEGSVNSIENGKVTIGLANGQTMTARLDSGVSITPGQSIFFEVKSNDGNLVQIRPVSLFGLEANPTLLKALDMANLAVNERTINMVNSLMQNSMSISPENLATMNRAIINNPEADIQTLVTMAKHDLPLSPENVSMFQNYASDKAMLTDNFQVISDMLPELMTSEQVSTADVISINNTLTEIFVSGEQAFEQVNPEVTDAAINEAASKEVTPQDLVASSKPEVIITPEGNQLNPENPAINQNANQPEAAQQASITEQNTAASKEAEIQQTVAQNDLGNQVLNSFASEKQITSFNTLLNSLPDFPKDNLEIFREDGNLKTDADIKQVFREITTYLNDHPNISKETLNDIIRSPLYRGILKNIISNSFAMEPKEVTKPGEISKLYERVLKQTEALERLVANFNNKAADTIKNQTQAIKQNINFMNSANDMYNFVQIPLKMYNQNTDSMLYVRQNKKGSYQEGEEITAFLHFDMEHLGSTDVFISLKETKVGCKWNLESEESMKLIEDNLDILTERLNKKGFSVSSEVTCGNPKASFVEDFLGAVPVSNENQPEGLVHRYSFDMRA